LGKNSTNSTFTPSGYSSAGSTIGAVNKSPTSLMSSTNTTDQNFMDQFKKFIVDNGIIGTCAGVIIALVTKDLILSLVGDIIIPVFIILFLKLNIKWLTAVLPGKSTFDFTSFFKNLISWMITMMVTFFFIQTTFEFLLGIKKEDKKEDKKKESFFSR
jgi:large-conductance mechanosensitive channel